MPPPWLWIAATVWAALASIGTGAQWRLSLFAGFMGAAPLSRWPPPRTCACSGSWNALGVAIIARASIG